MSRKLITFILIATSYIIFVFLLSIPLTGLAHDSGTTPGPFLSLVLKAPLTPTPTPTHTATPSYGILLISEVMIQPSGIEPDGEWVELYNSGGATLNLSAYKLGDEETRRQGEGMLVFPPGASLTPGQVIIVANKAANFLATYGFTPDYEINASSSAVPDMRKYTSWASGTISLVNNGDEVLVLDGSDTVVDSLSWGDSSWAFYPACPFPGLAMTLERYPAYIDTDTSNDWRQQPVPAPGRIGLTLPTSTPTRTPTHTATPTTTASLINTLTPSSTHTPLNTPTTALTQTHTPTPSPTFTNTCTATETSEPTYSPTPTETPTQTPSPIPTGGWLLISEVLYNPAGIEPDGEWIELYNAGSAAIILTEYKVGDEETPGYFEGMYKFPLNTTILPEQVIIIANRADVFTNTYGFYPDYELINSDPNVPDMSIYLSWAPGVVNLNNMGDEVLVLDDNNSFVDAVSWGDSNWAFDPDCPVVADNHSLERVPANGDTDTAADWIGQALPNPGQVNPDLFQQGEKQGWHTVRCLYFACLISLSFQHQFWVKHPIKY